MATRLILPEAETIRDHPFIEAVQDLLRDFLPQEIVSRFRIDLEVDVYNKDSLAMYLQAKNRKFVAEVRYREGDGLEYICDIYSWTPKAQTKATLLRYITDKFKTGAIGKDWQLRSDNTIALGKYESPDAEVVQTSLKPI